MLEQGTQAPSPAPDLIPAKTKNPEDSHWDWYSKRGHFTATNGSHRQRYTFSMKKGSVESLKLRLRCGRRPKVWNSTVDFI
jgi:hypothetical protein